MPKFAPFPPVLIKIDAFFWDYASRDYISDHTVNRHLDLMTELIERDKNHPSVVMWSVGSHRSDSESENVSRHLKRMMEFTRKMDMQKRPVTYLISSDYRFGVMEDPAVCTFKRV